MLPMLFQATLAAFVVSLACLCVLLLPAVRTLMLDRPNERSLHVQPTPRLGGLGIAAGVMPFVFGAGSTIATFLGCALFLMVLSLADDLDSLPIEVRLPAHACAALVAVLASSSPSAPWPWGWAGAVFVVVAIVAIRTAFEFTTERAIGTAIVALIVQAVAVFLIALLIAAIFAIPFAIFNWLF